MCIYNMSKIKMVATLLILFIVVLSLVLYLTANDIIFRSDLSTKEWDSFKKDTISDYAFIKRMSLGSSATGLFVFCKIGSEPEKQEVKEVFERIRDFILSKDEFEYLQKKHVEKYGDVFIRIYVRFDSSEKNEVSDYEFLSSINNDGEVTSDSFKEWVLNYMDGSSEIYK